MQKLEDILWSRVVNNGNKCSGEIGYELYQDMQGYMMQVKENLRRHKQQQRIEIDNRKQSEELMLRSLSNEA